MHLGRTLCFSAALVLAACGGGGSGGGTTPGDGGLDGSRDGSTSDATQNGSGGGGQGGGNGAGGGGQGSGGESTADAAPACKTPEECTALCGPDALWNGHECAPCPPCNDEGEIGRWPKATRHGYCICETAPGYFFSTAGRFAAVPCDADGDGWVRESAREAIDAVADEELTTNARCSLRRVSSITLRNDRAKDLVVELQAPLDLYESDRNDDDGLLAFRWKNDGLPYYHVDGTPPPAAALNSFTKLCHAATTDYNDDGLPDVSEYGDSPLPPEKAKLRPFVQFSYFAELHRGFYKAGLAGADGTYIIQEKSRKTTATPDKRVSVKMGPSEQDYWRDCEIQRDSQWNQIDPPVGMDFASYDPTAAWGGMTYHSLFKCMLVADRKSDKNANQTTPAELSSQTDYRINRCRAQGQATPQADNPSDASYACDVIASGDAQLGEAYWGAYRYHDYNITYDDPTLVEPANDPTLAPAYIRGCINACAKPDQGCAPIPAPPPDPTKIFACIHDPNDFGKKLGCAEQCDGKDNDGDGKIDNGTNGLPCARAYPGDCAFGKTNCQDSVFTCVGPMPGDKPELCDGHDNNCNGIGDYAAPNAPDAGPSSSGPDPALLGQGNSCNDAVDPDTGTKLLARCAQGTRQCVLPKGAAAPQMLCISDVDIAPENPCDNSDNNCDGRVDETWSIFEGDGRNGRHQCGDRIDDDCSGDVAEPLSVSQPSTPVTPNDTYKGLMGWRICHCGTTEVPACGRTESCFTICNDRSKKGDCSGVPVEVCDNDIDDDCDGYVDEQYDTVKTDTPYTHTGFGTQAPNSWPVAELCRFPCTTQGATRCAIPNKETDLFTAADIAKLKGARQVPEDALTSPKVTFHMYPPWFEGFQKVLVCDKGYWKIQKVCGAGALKKVVNNVAVSIPEVDQGWGDSANVGTPYCVELDAGKAQCSDTGGEDQVSTFVWTDDMNWAQSNLDCIGSVTTCMSFTNGTVIKGTSVASQ